MSDTSAPPTIGPPSLSATVADGMVRTTIAYPQPMAGSRPVLGVALYVGTSDPARPDRVPAINLSDEAGQFERTTCVDESEFHAVLAFDDATPPTVSEPAFEALIGGDPPAETVAWVRAFVQAFLVAELETARLARPEDLSLARDE